MRCHIGTPAPAPLGVVASSVTTKLLYSRLSWSIDVLQELRHLPNPPRRATIRQPDNTNLYQRQRLSSWYWVLGADGIESGGA
jgi:hypothetical protein